MTLPVALLAGILLGLIVAWADSRRVRRRAARRSRIPPASAMAKAPAAGPRPADGERPRDSEREVAAAWLQFLRKEVADTVVALNSRLTVIRALAQTLRAEGAWPKVREGLEQVLLEVDRAAAATATLQRSVTSEAPPPAPPSVPAAGARAERAGAILVVDSDDSVREVVGRLFRSLGHRVVPAHDGVEGFNVLASERVDCVIAATHLSRLSGVSFYNQVEQRLPFASRRFVFICGETQRPEVLEFLEGTGCPVIPKPFDVSLLVQAVNGVIARVKHDPAQRRSADQIAAAHLDDAAETAGGREERR